VRPTDQSTHGFQRNRILSFRFVEHGAPCSNNSQIASGTMKNRRAVCTAAGTSGTSSARNSSPHQPLPGKPQRPRKRRVRAYKMRPSSTIAKPSGTSFKRRTQQSSIKLRFAVTTGHCVTAFIGCLETTLFICHSDKEHSDEEEICFSVDEETRFLLFTTRIVGMTREGTFQSADASISTPTKEHCNPRSQIRSSEPGTFFPENPLF